MKSYYVIKNGNYYLSNRYEIAAEKVLGYGGVFTKSLDEVKVFDTKCKAEKELRIMRNAGCGKSCTIEKREVKEKVIFR